MKKKLISALLMGALFVSSTSVFVSCKDYDDDINGLKSQINELSTQVGTKESTIKTSISTLEASLATLKTQLSSELSTGDQATLIAAIAAIDEAKAELNRTISAKADVSDVNDLTLKNAEQDQAIIKAQTAADQALNQLEELIAAFTAASRGDNDSQSLADVQAAVASIKQMKSDLADLNSKYNSLSADVSKAIADIADLKTAVAGQQAALEALAGESGDMSQIADNIKTLLSKMEALEKQVGELGSEKTLADVIKGINQKVEDLEKQIGGSSNPELNTLTTALAKALRSLVYMPKLYVDGIESIEYPYLEDSLLKATSGLTMKRQRPGFNGYFDEDYEKTIRDGYSNNFKWLTHLTDHEYDKTNSKFIDYYGPVWPVEYHMNPSRSTTSFADVLGWNRREVEVITRSQGGNSLSHKDLYADGTQLFENKDGILKVGLQIKTPEYLANHATPTEAAGRPGNTYENEKTGGIQYDDIIALQVKSEKLEGDQDAESKIITSDYAMIYPTKALVEGIVWTKLPTKKGYENKNDRDIDFDEKGFICSKNIHVWDDPREALAATAATKNVYPDVELSWDSKDGICLKDYLGIHLIKTSKTIANGGDNKNSKDDEYDVIKFNDAEFGQWGLSCEFQLVGYSIDGNKTIDSNYAMFTDEKIENGERTDGLSSTGTIIPRNVDDQGKTIVNEPASEASVGREPLVRVLVYCYDNEGNKRVIKDGYILLHIDRKAEQNTCVINSYPENPNAVFDLCSTLKVFDTDWSQFHSYVLDDARIKLTKDEFDAQYGAQQPGVPDLMGTVNPVTLNAGSTPQADNSMRYDDVQLYDLDNGSFRKCTARDLPGYVSYYHNSVGTTNHRFEWYLSEDEMEEYTHDRDLKANLPREITKYIRYTAKPKSSAKYDYIYVKMTIKLTRKEVAETGIKEKNKNYWFSIAGEDALQKGIFDAVVWNPAYPQNYGDTRAYTQELVSTFVGNKVNFVNTTGLATNINSAMGTDKAKFYFIPVNFEIKGLDGTVYTITPRSSNADENWNAFICKYHGWMEDGTNGIDGKPNSVVHNGTWHNLHWWKLTDSHVKETDVNKDSVHIHKWGDYAHNQEIHKECAIDYTRGVYANNKLYAVTNYGTPNAVYRQIATLNQSINNGTMTLTWNTLDGDADDKYTRAVLNAIGYVPEHQNIVNPVGETSITETLADGTTIEHKFDECKYGQLHTMVGVIANNGCDVAVNINQFAAGENNVNAGTFYVSWHRPINVSTNATPMVDAKDNGDKIYTVDFLKLYDWRGPIYGKMYGDKQWLWAYYNIRALRISTDVSKITTNMHQSSVNDFKPLNSITTQARLSVMKQDGSLIPVGTKVGAYYYVEIPINSISTYNSATMNEKLQEAMGLVPVDNDKKETFAGGLFYANNGDNVQQFDVKIPVTVVYDWGEFISNVVVHIDRTQGN